MTQTNTFAQKLLGPSIFTPKALIPYVGSRAAALLQQLHYSQQNSPFTEYGERWVSCTLEDWGKILSCHKRTIKRAFDRLESMGLVVSDHFHKHLYDRCKSYPTDCGFIPKCNPTIEWQGKTELWVRSNDAN